MKKGIIVIFILAIFSYTIKVDASNIVKGYTYNQEKETENYCVTGDEDTCKETTCYDDEKKDSCKMGTIIDYKVNDSKIVRFYVLHDDGETMTLQQRENTVYNIQWYSSADNTKGPLTILVRLEDVTKDWTNVNNQTYTMGTTKFGGNNAFTGCDSYNSCTANTYTLESRTAKARMITMQEAAKLGCTRDSQSCPKYMNNYLYDSTSYGGTVNDDHAENGEDHIWGYWTMSAHSANSYAAWHVNRIGGMSYYSTNHSKYINYGARAVVEINKVLKSEAENSSKDSITNTPAKENKGGNQVVNVKDTFKTSYIGYCLGTIILILGIMVLYQEQKRDRVEINIKNRRK